MHLACHDPHGPLGKQLPVLDGLAFEQTSRYFTLVFSLNLNFDLTDTTTLRGSASSDGETGLGIFWERDY